MNDPKEGIRSQIHVGYDGKVYKTYRGDKKQERFDNEVRILRELEARGCDFVPRILEVLPEALSIVTTNCGEPVEHIGQERIDRVFETLREDFGIVHSDPEIAYLTFDSHRGKFCVNNFENAELLGSPVELKTASTLTWCGLSRSGMRKPENEDSLAVFNSKNGWATEESLQGRGKSQSGCLTFVVSDGMGGHSGGAVASKMVVTQLTRYIPAQLGDSSSPGSPSGLIEDAIQSLHYEVLLAADTSPEVDDMGATIVCGFFCGGELHYGHVGDSRLYRFRDGHLEQLTEDHSFVGQLVHDGKISEREARINPRKNILTQAIGARCLDISPDIDSTRVRPNDWFLFCSDGLIDGLWDKQIEQEFLMATLTRATPKAVATNLLNRAYEAAGRDDTTLFVIQAE